MDTVEREGDVVSDSLKVSELAMIIRYQFKSDAYKRKGVKKNELKLIALKMYADSKGDEGSGVNPRIRANSTDTTDDSDALDTTATNGSGVTTDHASRIDNETAATEFVVNGANSNITGGGHLETSAACGDGVNTTSTNGAGVTADNAASCIDNETAATEFVGNTGVNSTITGGGDLETSAACGDGINTTSTNGAGVTADHASRIDNETATTDCGGSGVSNLTAMLCKDVMDKVEREGDVVFESLKVPELTMIIRYQFKSNAYQKKGVKKNELKLIALKLYADSKGDEGSGATGPRIGANATATNRKDGGGDLATSAVCDSAVCGDMNTTPTNGNGVTTNHAGCINNETAATDLEGNGGSDLTATNGAGVRNSAAGIDGVNTTPTNGNGVTTDHAGRINNETAATDLEGNGGSDLTAGGNGGSKFYC